MHPNLVIVVIERMRGNYSAALDMCNEILIKHPNNSDIWNEKGLTLFEKAVKSKKDTDITKNELDALFLEARKCFTKAQELKENFDIAWYNEGLVHLEEKNYMMALYCFNKAIEINPSDTDYQKAQSIASKNQGLSIYNELLESYKKE